MVQKFDARNAELESKVKAKESKEADEPEKVPTDVSYLKGKKGVPDFWIRAIKNNKLIMEEMKDNDKKIL